MPCRVPTKVVVGGPEVSIMKWVAQTPLQNPVPPLHMPTNKGVSQPDVADVGSVAKVQHSSSSANLADVAASSAVPSHTASPAATAGTPGYSPAAATLQGPNAATTGAQQFPCPECSKVCATG